MKNLGILITFTLITPLLFTETKTTDTKVANQIQSSSNTSNMKTQAISTAIVATPISLLTAASSYLLSSNQTKKKEEIETIYKNQSKLTDENKKLLDETAKKINSLTKDITNILLDLLDKKLIFKNLENYQLERIKEDTSLLFGASCMSDINVDINFCINRIIKLYTIDGIDQPTTNSMETFLRTGAEENTSKGIRKILSWFKKEVKPYSNVFNVSLNYIISRGFLDDGQDYSSQFGIFNMDITNHDFKNNKDIQSVISYMIQLKSAFAFLKSFQEMMTKNNNKLMEIFSKINHMNSTTDITEQNNKETLETFIKDAKSEFDNILQNDNNKLNLIEQFIKFTRNNYNTYLQKTQECIKDTPTFTKDGKTIASKDLLTRSKSYDDFWKYYKFIKNTLTPVFRPISDDIEKNLATEYPALTPYMNSENFFNHYIGDSKSSLDQAIESEKKVEEKEKKDLTSQEIETKKVLNIVMTQKQNRKTTSAPSPKNLERLKTSKEIAKLKQQVQKLKDAGKILQNRVDKLDSVNLGPSFDEDDLETFDD